MLPLPFIVACRSPTSYPPSTPPLRHPDVGPRSGVTPRSLAPSNAPEHGYQQVVFQQRRRQPVPVVSKRSPGIRLDVSRELSVTAGPAPNVLYRQVVYDNKSSITVATLSILKEAGG